AKAAMLSCRSEPAVGTEVPVMMLASVGLPEPDGPMMARHSPGARQNDTPFSIKWSDPGRAAPTLLTTRLPFGLSGRALMFATGMTADMMLLSRRQVAKDMANAFQPATDP